MKTIGIIMWGGGLVLAAYAGLLFDPSVSGYGGGRIVNMDLQQRQMMMLIVGCVLFAVGVVLHAMSVRGEELPNAVTTAPKVASDKQGASIHRIAYARQLGISETDEGYNYGGQTYVDLEDAIKAADPDNLKAMPDFDMAR
jgi:hypothetical protein